MYVENMLRLEGGAFGVVVRSTMLAAVMDLLRDSDVRILEFLNDLITEISDMTFFMIMLHILTGGDWTK